MQAPTSAPAQTAAPPRSSGEAAAACFHCGLPNPPGRRFEAPIRGEQRRFCCAGCLAVAQTIHAAGLEGFYAARTSAAAWPAGNADGAEPVTHGEGNRSGEEPGKQP